MITDKKTRKEFLAYEKKLYFPEGEKGLLRGLLLNSKEYRVWRYIRTLRYAEYYKNKKSTPLSRLLFAFYHRRKYCLGYSLGFEIPENCFDQGLMIYHFSPVIVNEDARIGKDCRISGNLCIGNKGPGTKSPVIGDRVSLGFGAVILGDIRLADEVRIGAGSVVTKSVLCPGAVAMGVPAAVRDSLTDTGQNGEQEEGWRKG